MTTALVLIAVLALLAVVGETLREVFRDGPSSHRPPRSHEGDRQFLPPSHV